MALFVALQIVLARYLSYQISHSTRISLANVPNLLAGIWLGPISGAFTAMTSDILGLLLQPSSGVSSHDSYTHAVGAFSRVFVSLVWT